MRVYYDPARPEFAVIQKQGFDAVAPIAVGSRLLTVGLWLAKRDVRKRRAYERWLEDNPGWMSV